MKGILWVLVFTLLAAGCATPGQKDPWEGFWKDLRGDNMEMRGFGMSEDKHSD